MHALAPYPSKDRVIALPPISHRHRTLSLSVPASPAPRYMPPRSVPAQEKFSPLIQEFLDECGYSEK